MRSALFLLAGLLAAAYAQSNCCVPSQSVSQSWISGPSPNDDTKIINALATTYYDAIGQNLRIDYIMNVTLASQNYTSAFLNYSLYFEYTQSIVFYVDHIRGACYPLPLSGQFATVCTDKLPYTFLTSLQVGDQVAALWGNNTASVALSSSCIPIFSRASDAPLGLTVNTFVFNLIPKLPSNAFTLPSACRPHTKREVMSADEELGVNFGLRYAVIGH